MLTTKPISTISYNSETFLLDTLNRLTKSHILVEWFYIHHNGEPDDDGVAEKDHFHVYMQPNKRVDTEELRDMFVEIDLACPDKPLKCMPFKTSKIDDWILYGVHDVSYLEIKGLERQFHYSMDDIKTSEPEFLQRVFRHAIESVSKDFVKRSNMLKMGVVNAYSSGYASNADIHALSVVQRMEILEASRDKAFNQLKHDYDVLMQEHLSLLDKTNEGFTPTQIIFKEI